MISTQQMLIIIYLSSLFNNYLQLLSPTNFFFCSSQEDETNLFVLDV